MPRQMIEPRRHHARRRADREESSAEHRDARLQRKHPSADARQRAAQAAVIGSEYGGGFRHRRTRAVTCLPRQHRCATLVRMTAISISELHEHTALWVPLPESLAHAARRKISELPPTTFLRAADALHLTCAVEEGCTAIHTSDRHMTAAAPAFGLQAVTL